MTNYNNGDYGVYEKYINTNPKVSNEKYRYLLELRTECLINSENHLVVICMNPSTADDKITDATTNEIIRTMFIMGYKGFTLFNLYPERATNPNDLTSFSDQYMNDNIQVISDFLNDNPDITEVWGAWGNISKDPLIRGKEEILDLLNERNIRVFYFGQLTKKNEPPHPLNRQSPKFRKINLKKDYPF